MIADPLQDPRVRMVDEYLYAVEGAQDCYFVEASETDLGSWWTNLQKGSPSRVQANLQTRDEVEAWLAWNRILHPSLRDALIYALTRVGQPL